MICSSFFRFDNLFDNDFPKTLRFEISFSDFYSYFFGFKRYFWIVPYPLRYWSLLKRALRFLSLTLELRSLKKFQETPFYIKK